ncbi:MAG: DUF1850 domain-containing protein [Lachnospiraceae bacterium]|nr:DUF1850 domain-containing protein [Lachnospiraceae bacterium]
MNKKRFYFAVTAAVIFTAAVMLCIIISITKSDNKELVLRDLDTGKVYARYQLKEGDTFSITFVHSVNKSPVTEVYQIRNDKIYLEECLYYAFGAGVATTLEGEQTLSYGENGEMIISNINTLMYDLIYVVGTVSDHVLELQNTEISLRELCGQNSSVSFIYE